MPLTDRFDAALAYASRLHRDQRRKGTDIPYVSHLLSVCALALEDGADEDQAIAALLHDAVEDQDVTVDEIAARFGPRVAAIVADCTDGSTDDRADRSVEGWRRRKQAYVAGLAAKPQTSLLVSLADKTHNARAIVTDLAVHGDAIFGRFTGGRDGTLWYYSALADIFDAARPGPAARRLRALVEDMRAAR